MELALETGAEDVKSEGNEFEVITDPASFEKVKKAIDAKGIKHLEASIGMIPSNTVKLELNKAEQMLKMMEKLEDNDDVQNVYANFDIDDDVMEKLS
jgi:transcriptional/translational regulatory protein YebC/TACO1